MDINNNIIQNCLDILLTDGIRVCMDDIAKKLSMSKRTLYEIFENKNELIYKCISLFIGKEKEEMEHYLSNNGSNIIEELFPLLNIDIHNRIKEHRTFFIEVKRYYPEIFEKVVAVHLSFYRSYMGKIVKKGIEQGYFKDDINVEIVTVFLFELTTSPKQNNELFRKYTMPNIFKNTVLCYIRGISTTKGQQLIDNVIGKDYTHFENDTVKKTNKTK